MSGFCLEIRHDPRVAAGPLRVVDLGAPNAMQLIAGPQTRLAWTRWRGSKQLHLSRDPTRVVWIEGAPDRLPDESETIEQWLSGRWGSFRGLEIALSGGAPAVTCFTDPLGTRPIYFLQAGEATYISDKLATLLVNAAGPHAPNWGAVLEAAVVSTLYSNDSTVAGAVMLRGGETVVFERDRVTRRAARRIPSDAHTDPERVRRAGAATLREALQRAIADTWADPEAYLLLSGGLDSRLVLALAAPPRKALTVTTRDNRESRLAQEIAAACQAHLEHLRRPVEHYLSVLRNGFLLTGAAWDSTMAHHLGLGAGWRGRGITSVVHAYQFDAVLKGNRIGPYQKYVNPARPLASIVGSRATYFSGLWLGRDSPLTAERVLGLLSAEGRDLAGHRLRDIAASLDPVVIDGLDVTLEKRLTLPSISRGPSYPTALAWFEALDVDAPIYHPAIWAWFEASRPRHRYRGKALREALLGLRHPAACIPGANTGRPIRAVPRWQAWRDALRNQPWYPALRTLRPHPQRATAPGYPDDGSWPPLMPLFRAPDGIDTLTAGLAPLESIPLFDWPAIRAALGRYQSGRDEDLEALLALSGAGRFLEAVQQGTRFSHPAIHEVTARPA